MTGCPRSYVTIVPDIGILVKCWMPKRKSSRRYMRLFAGYIAGHGFDVGAKVLGHSRCCGTVRTFSSLLTLYQRGAPSTGCPARCRAVSYDCKGYSRTERLCHDDHGSRYVTTRLLPTACRKRCVPCSGTATSTRFRGGTTAIMWSVASCPRERGTRSAGSAPGWTMPPCASGSSDTKGAA